MKSAKENTLQGMLAILNFLIILCFLLFTNSSASAYTNSGTISADETWSGTIEIVSDVTVAWAVSLNIESGTVIRFADGAGLLISGNLEAMGTAASPITFTSVSPMPTKGIWKGISFYDTSLDASVIDHAVIQYANQGVFIDNASPPHHQLFLLR